MFLWLAVPLWTDPGLKSGIRCTLSPFNLKKKKKVRAGIECSNLLPKSSQVRKKPPQPAKYYGSPKAGVTCIVHATFFQHAYHGVFAVCTLTEEELFCLVTQIAVMKVILTFNQRHPI